jgi:hypothetical protein
LFGTGYFGDGSKVIVYVSFVLIALFDLCFQFINLLVNFLIFRVQLFPRSRKRHVGSFCGNSGLGIVMLELGEVLGFLIGGFCKK